MRPLRSSSVSLVLLVLSGSLLAGYDSASAGTLSGFVGKPQLPAFPLPGIAVRLYDSSRSFVTEVTTGADGLFSFPGLAAGNYYLITRKDDDDRVDLAWPSVPCPQLTCGSFSTATPIAVPASGEVTIAPPFFLPLGVTFSGSVTATVGGAGLHAQVFGMPSSANFQLVGNTDAAGNFSIPGYPTESGGNAITYQVRVNPTGADHNYIGEAYDNIPCPNGACDLNAVGSVVAVSAGTPTVLNFVLDAGSAISGHAYVGPGTSTPASAPGLTVWVYSLAGVQSGVASVFGGFYSVEGLAAGSYRAVLVGDNANSFLASQIWDGIPCFGASCVPPSSGTTIVVGAATTFTADFHLDQGMRVTGSVLDGATGADLFLGSAHVYAGAASTDLGQSPVLAGHYALTLPPGPPVRLGLLTGGPYVDEMWNDHRCIGACPGSVGDVIPIVAGTEFVANFALDPGGLDFYTMTPCRALDTRTLNDPLPAGTVRGYPLGSACAVPFDAVAVAVNVTVVAPPGTGSLALWASETASTPTSALNFKAGLTRANNGVVAVGHDIASGVNAKLTMSPAGAAHLVIDVTGYFVRSPI